ncbi:MAG: ferritin family protein [Candidatus Brocadiia bacterium]|jgi:rubrerythrin
MPEFVNPFTGVVPGRKLTPRELTRAIRMALSAEEEAVHQYQSVADATDDPLAKALLNEIADEERVHKGEFQRLLNILLPDEANYLAQGAAEVNELASKVKGQPAAESAPPSVGSLKS